MRFGMCVMADVDEIGFFKHAEDLGYDSVWVTDSQMIFSDCYAVLALAAQHTHRIRLGPGTAICGTRIPPVHVAAMATLNKLAPGRVHIGIGTGNTAMRTMGQRPMRIAEYDEYLRVLAALLRGETVEYRYRDRVRPVRMLTDNKKYLSLEPKIPLYVSGFGPRAMELAGKHGDGLVFAIPPRGIAVSDALGHAPALPARAASWMASATARLRTWRCSSPVRQSILRVSSAPSVPTSWPASTISTTRCRSEASSRPTSCVRSGSVTARSWRRHPPSTGTSAATSSTTPICTPGKPS
jgi:alkanesulfonate monooxygenase SsuD/methylene tetrahydromethanopterin reductase-like flavin-dependent oxidoreductase (luciferase family)